MSSTNSSSSKRRRYEDEESESTTTNKKLENSSHSRDHSSSSNRDSSSKRSSHSSRDDRRDRDSRDSRDYHHSSSSSSRRNEEDSSRKSSSSSSRRDRSRDRYKSDSRSDSRDHGSSSRSSRNDERDRESNNNNNNDNSRNHYSPSRSSSSKPNQPPHQHSPASSPPPPSNTSTAPSVPLIPISLSPSVPPLPPTLVKKSFNSTFSSSSTPASSVPNLPASPTLSTISSAPGTPMSPSLSTGAGGEDEKLRLKREKLEAWKLKKAAAAASNTGSMSPMGSPAPKGPVVRNFTLPVAVVGKNGLPNKPVTITSNFNSLPSKPISLPSNPNSNSRDQQASIALLAAQKIASSLIIPANNNGTPSNRLAGNRLPSIPVGGVGGLPAKPGFSFGGNSMTGANGNGFKSSNLKNSLTMGEEEVEVEKVGLMSFDSKDDEVEDSKNEFDESNFDEEEDEEDLEGSVVFRSKLPGGGRSEVVDKMDVDVKEDVVMKEVEEEEEEDELEMFMSKVTAQVKNVDKEDSLRLTSVNPSTISKGKGKNVLIEPEEGEDSDIEPGSGDEVDKVGDEAADILALAAKKVVRRGRELHTLDHSKIAYEPFRKAFYHAPSEIELLTPEQVEEIRVDLDGIKVRGVDVPRPAVKWSYCGLPAPCIEVIKNLGYTAPTSIQAQAIPAIMSGRDIIGVAKTGSGKTIAFLLPMFRHIKDQRPLKSMEGPIAMIMTPTRELATQIHKECKPFLKALGLRASCAYGGTPLKDNIADMKRGSEIIVCTPGRMIELLTTNSGRIINLHRVSYLVLDEADRMFDMGFEPQVMKIINQIRPDRQTVLFSATFPRQMEALARKILSRPLEITVGGRSIVAPEIDQIVEVRTEDTKFNRLLEFLGRLSNDEPDARALIFVERQDSADSMLQNLLKKNYSCMSLHGGMEQVDRDQTIADFKTGVIPIVIATSVAARGLDVKQLRLVIQYDAPNHMEDYVHRAGRTGRAGQKGTCVTFVTPDQDRYALDIFKALVASNATVPEELRLLAETFAEKVKAGKESVGSGFGGKGLERLDNDRDAQSRAERAAYGESAVEKKPEESTTTTTTANGVTTTTTTTTNNEMSSVADDVADLEVEIKRGPAPERKPQVVSVTAAADDAAITAAATASIKEIEEAAIAAGMPVGAAKAKSVVALYNVMLKAKVAARTMVVDNSTDSARRRDPDATDFHAIIYINDYPQKARWKVTNKETMVQLSDSTGASITNKGVFYEPGKEPGPNDLPKLHLLIESNEEFRVKHAISEIKRSLIEGAVMAAEADQRNPAAAGRYNVV